MSGRKKKEKEEFLVRERPERYISDEEVISIIEKRLHEIINKKPSLKAKLKDMFSDVFVERSDMVKILEELRLQRESSDRRFEEINKRFETMDKRFEEMDKRFDALVNELRQHREDTNKRFERMDKRFEEMDKRFDALVNELRQHREDTNKRFEVLLSEFRKERDEMKKYIHNVISSIGSRWGEDIESAFRDGIKEILKKYFGADVKETYIKDTDGMIKGYPADYQVDLLITDDVHIIIDVKAQTDEMDVNKLHKIGMIYEKEKGIKPRLILLTGFVRRKAWVEVDKVKDVEIITSPSEFKPR